MNDNPKSGRSRSGGGGPAQVLVYVADADSQGVIRQALSDLGASDVGFKSADISQAILDLGQTTSPKLLIVDVGGVEDPPAKIQELVHMCEPSTAVLAVGSDNDIRLYRNILAAGATEYFFKPLVTAMVGRTCREILTGTRREAEGRTGRLIYVVGVRGGCGATTIGVRTAWKLSETPPRPVLAIDLDLKGGDAALQLDATPTHALTEGLAQAERVDDLFLERGLIHVTTHLDLLASLEPLDVAPRIDVGAFMALLDKVTRRYRYVVVDVPVGQVTDVADALHLPSTLLLVSDARLVSARDVARWRQWLGRNTAERTMMHVLNMNGAPGSLPIDEFARAAGQEPDVVIPYSKEIAASALLGVKAKPEIPVLDRGLEPVIAMLAGEAGVQKRSFLERVLG